MPMKRRLLATALLLASAGAVSSCASKEHVSPIIPPASDLRADLEPAYPDAALQDGPDGDKAAGQWNDDVLAWGRGEHLKVERLCQFFVEMGAALPFKCRPETAAPSSATPAAAKPH